MKSITIGSFSAKTHLSELLEKVARGATFVITRRGKPLAELRPLKPESPGLLFGSDKGRISISNDFDAPLEDFKEYME